KERVAMPSDLTERGISAETTRSTAELNARVPRLDWSRLRSLPWGIPLEEWPEHGVRTLTVRRGESRHPVLFVEAGGRRYAVKETSPRAAEREIDAFEELARRGCQTLESVGYVVVRGEPIVVGELAGHALYMPGDTGYCLTRLAEHVLPQSVLYRYPFTDGNKRLLWSAVAELLLDLHKAGAYWGDPSLANVLIDLSDYRLTAVMADAETAELADGPLSEGLRQRDLDAFVESLEWQAEDIRLARGLPEGQQLVTQGDADYFRTRYDGLRAERLRTHSASEHVDAQALDLLRQMRRLNALGYGMLHLVRRGARVAQADRAEEAPDDDSTARASATPVWQTATVRPGWYVRTLRELLGVRVPRAYAQRLYQHLLIHKWLLSERAEQDVGMDAAARDWMQHYHEPLLAFIAAYLPDASADATFDSYLAILDHTWEMSQRERRPVPLEEGAIDYVLSRTQAAPFPVVPPSLDGSSD
ncbi:MAG TPA: DUF4032 domain-containing protein, partial [Ktedonobacterales bacterium]